MDPPSNQAAALEPARVQAGPSSPAGQAQLDKSAATAAPTAQPSANEKHTAALKRNTNMAYGQQPFIRARLRQHELQFKAAPTKTKFTTAAACQPGHVVAHSALAGTAPFTASIMKPEMGLSAPVSTIEDLIAAKLRCPGMAAMQARIRRSIHAHHKTHECASAHFFSVMSASLSPKLHQHTICNALRAKHK